MFKRLLYMTITISLFLHLTTGFVNASSDNYDVDFTDASEGIVKVLFENDSTNKFKLVIMNTDTSEKYVYNLTSDSDYVNFPLQLGDGKYAIQIYENTTGTKYKSVYSKAKKVSIDNDLDIYLQSVQEVNWNEGNQAIIEADKILQVLTEEENTVAELNTSSYSAKTASVNTLSDIERLEEIYNYVIENYAYDFAKISTLQYNYIPDIDEVYYEKQGICYDYAVLFASMLRSQGIPAKLVKGYSVNTDVYHAWNEVYIEDEDRWIIIDTTFDAYKLQNNLEYIMEKPTEDYTVSKIY